MSGKTSTPVCPVSQGGLYEGILAGVCTGKPTHIPTDIHTHMQQNTTQRHVLLCAHTHRVMTEQALSEVKYLQEMPHRANWLWWASASMPWCFPFFSFLFIPQFPLYLHKDNLKKSTKLGISSVWFISHKSLKISPAADAWLIAATNVLISKIRGEEFDLLSTSILLTLHNNILYLTPAMMEVKENVNFHFQDHLGEEKPCQLRYE